MKWEKRGLIYGPHGKFHSWDYSHALQPTPIVIGNKIRIYCGFRDIDGVSRVGFVDVNADNPSEILKVSKSPVLDIGSPGSFDENGVVPCSIIHINNKLYLYYAGYQLGQKVRFYVFGGLAVSSDNGETFKRIKKVPFMDRTDNELLFRVVHTALFEENVWKFWYGGGSEFKVGKTKTLPIYNIRYIESNDGSNFNGNGSIVLDTLDDEYRVARPYVIREKDRYLMFYCYGTETITYRIGYAESSDGLNWLRKDDKLGLELSSSGWDSNMMGYPSVIKYKNKMYIFYNGNDYGKEGFGYAETFI